MDKEYVTYEQAVALKELGFNEPCVCLYDEDIYLFSVREQDDIYDYWTSAGFKESILEEINENTKKIKK